MNGTWRTGQIVVGLLLLCTLLYLFDLGRIPLYNYEESKEALLVWEMVNGGGWILPLRNGVEQPLKPPLFHWIGALFSLLGGQVSELTVRLPAGLAAAATVLATFFFGRAVWNWRVGLLAALILATCPEWLRWAVRARSDMVLLFFLTAGQFLFFRAFEERAAQPRTLYLLYCAIGLAVLAKGPQGLLLPGFVAVVFLWRAGHLRLLGHMQLGRGALIAGCIAVSWYLLAWLQGGGEFFQRQILDENVYRFFSSAAGGPSREHGLFYYLPTVFTGMLPWSLFFPAVAVHIYRTRGALENRQRYLLCWLGVEFLFFSLASGKRSNYILPVYPALALLSALSWQVLMDASYTVSPTFRRVCRICAVVLGGLGGFVVLALLAHATGAVDLAEAVSPVLHPRDLANLPTISQGMRDMSPVVAVLFGSLAVATSWFLWAAYRHNWVQVFAALTLSASVALYVANALFHPLLATERTYKPFMLGVRSAVRDAPLYFYGSAPDYGAIFYAGRRIPELPESGIPELDPTAGRGVYLLVREKDWPKLSENYPDVQRLIASQGTGPDKKQRLILSAVLRPQPGRADHAREVAPGAAVASGAPLGRVGQPGSDGAF